MLRQKLGNGEMMYNIIFQTFITLDKLTHQEILYRLDIPDRDDRFRFSLQWSADTAEKAGVGILLEQLGNKKSDFIVMALIDYLQCHPEVAIPGAKINITYHEGTASGNGQGYGEDLCGGVFGRNGCPPGKELPILGNAA